MEICSNTGLQEVLLRNGFIKYDVSEVEEHRKLLITAVVVVYTNA